MKEKHDGMRIDEEYTAVPADGVHSRGWALKYKSKETKRVRVPKTGDIVETHTTWERYYSDFANVLKEYLKEQCTKASSISEIPDIVEKALKRISDAYESINSANEVLIEKYKNI